MSTTQTKPGSNGRQDLRVKIQDDDFLDRVAALAKGGMNRSQIADELGYSHPGFRNKLVGAVHRTGRKAPHIPNTRSLSEDTEWEKTVKQSSGGHGLRIDLPQTALRKLGVDVGDKVHFEVDEVDGVPRMVAVRADLLTKCRRAITR